MEYIDWSDFEKIDMRIGTVTKAEVFEEARKPAYKLWIDFGDEIGCKKTSAQITEHYKPNQLVGIQVVAVVNFPQKQIANFMSECLVIGAVGEDGVTLLGPNRAVKDGLRIM